MHEHATEPNRPGAPDTVTTHISLLVLTGNQVLKFRKPIVTDFCDFTTIEARLHDCRREVELNRRLTDDVYLGVGRVHPEEGDVIEAEPCVIMRRLPAERLLSALVVAGEDIDEEVLAIAQQLADFHSRAAPVTASDPDDAPRTACERWADAIQQLRAHSHDRVDTTSIDELDELSTQWCTGRAPLFRSRLDEGFVRDGHGDLRAENIFCLDDGPRILDCIEFDDQLRLIDVASDLAFLVMDLRRMGRASEAEALITEYERVAGTPVPRGLLDHDAAYWALVRAKVSHLRADQGDPIAHRDAIALETLALEELRRTRVRLVVIGGLPGTGKSTAARDLAELTGWAVVSSDVVRKELVDLPATARTGDEYGKGLYRPDRIAATYTEMLRRARRSLEHGQSVILDASWSRSSDRADAASLALVSHADLHEIHCTVDDEVARERIVARARDDADASDADLAVARQMAAIYEPWPSATSIDTAATIEKITLQLREVLGIVEGG